MKKIVEMLYEPEVFIYHVLEEEVDALARKVLGGVLGDLAIVHAQNVVQRLNQRHLHVVLRPPQTALMMASCTVTAE